MRKAEYNRLTNVERLMVLPLAIHTLGDRITYECATRVRQS